MFKEAFITPVLKKPGLDVTNMTSYGPIPNLSVLWKLLEWLVVCTFRWLVLFNLVFSRVIPPKLLFCKCSLMLLTVVI